jgi:hypothetical protein
MVVDFVVNPGVKPDVSPRKLVKKSVLSIVTDSSFRLISSTITRNGGWQKRA